MLKSMRPMSLATNQQASRQLLRMHYHRTSKLDVRADISVRPPGSHHEQSASRHISISPTQHVSAQSSSDKHGASSLIPVVLAGAGETDHSLRDFLWLSVSPAHTNMELQCCNCDSIRVSLVQLS